MIRPATDSDREWLLSECRKFFDASGYGRICTFRPDDLMQTLEGLPILLVDDQHRGMAGAAMFPAFMDFQARIAQELFWWVSPEHRGSGVATQLMDALELAAREHGCKALFMLAIDRLDGKRVGQIYRGRGYWPAERLFMRKL